MTFEFSPHNFHPYFAAFCQVYGALLFCIYFESFRQIIRPDRKVIDRIDRIRLDLHMTPRWPEMVTPEELNLKPPTPNETIRMTASAVQAAFRKRFLHAESTQRKKLALEKRFLRELFTLMAKDQKGKQAAGQTPS